MVFGQDIEAVAMRNSPEGGLFAGVKVPILDLQEYTLAISLRDIFDGNADAILRQRFSVFEHVALNVEGNRRVRGRRWEPCGHGQRYRGHRVEEVIAPGDERVER